MVSKIYEKLKRSKNKKLLNDAKLILNINEKERNDYIREDILAKKRLYATKYLLYKNYLNNRDDINNFDNINQIVK